MRHCPAPLNSSVPHPTCVRNLAVSDKTYSAKWPAIALFKRRRAGHERIRGEFLNGRRMRRPKYDLWLHLRLVGPSYSPARRPPKKSLGRTRVGKEGRRETGQNYEEGTIVGLVYSVLDAPSRGMRRRWCPTAGRVEFSRLPERRPGYRRDVSTGTKISTGKRI